MLQHGPSRAVGLLTYLAIFAVFSPDAAAQSPVITSAPSLVAAGPDYATDVLNNPWDLTDISDLSPFPDEFSGWTNSATTARTIGRAAFLSNGQFVARTTPGGANLIPLLYRGGAQFITSAHENSGVFDHKAIPTALYGKLAVAMTLSASTGGQLAAFWYSGPYGAANESGRGVAFRTPGAGTHLYLVDLVTGVWTDARGNPASPYFHGAGTLPQIAWSDAGLMRGFQIRATSDGAASVNVSVDWVRLTQRDGGVGAASLPITFSGCAGRDYNVEVAAGDSWAVIHTGTAAAVGATTASVNHGILPPGTWQFRVTCFPISRVPTGGVGVSSAPVSVAINAPPLVSVQEPDSIGPDYATEVLGNPWDMNAVSDVRQIFGVASSNIVFDGLSNTLQATATAAGDPALVFVYGSLLDTSRYRYLTFSLALDTSFGLGGPGEGSVARVYWERPSASGGNALTISQDIIVWPGRNVYTIDLSQLTLQSGLLETECLPGCAQQPWNAGPIRYFRIDPHESTLGVQFRLGPTYLTGPDEVALGSAFAMPFTFSDPDTSGSSYTAHIYIDTDRNLGSRVLLDAIQGIAPNVPQSYSFNPAARGVPPGEYYFFIEITESRGGFVETQGSYTTGPLRVGGAVTGPTAPGAPTLNPVQVASNPVTVAWSPGPGGAPTNYTLTVGTAPNTANLAAFNMGLATSASGHAPPGVRLYARVIATNAAGSAVSNEVSFVVGGGVGVPGPPSLNARAVSGRTVELAWSAPVSGGPPSGYVVIARVAGIPTIVATLPVVGTSAVIPNVPPGSYVVTVVAVNPSGVSPESNALSVVVP